MFKTCANFIKLHDNDWVQIWLGGCIEILWMDLYKGEGKFKAIVAALLSSYLG